MKKILITTVPFGDKNRLPIDLIEAAGFEYEINPLGRKLRAEELVEMASDCHAIIAGTEPITSDVFKNAPNLELVSRVGIGLDSVDLLAARAHNVQVSYTPDAPAPAVAELTVGFMLTLLRHVHIANKQLHDGQWQRHFGRRIPEVTIGVIGVGRIGRRVLSRLRSFGTPRILVNDISVDTRLVPELKLEWVSKDEIYANADIVSLHLPLTAATKGMVGKREMEMMKPDAIIINAARGGIVNEDDLAAVLQSGHLTGAAVDVFENEPYQGPLANIDNCLLTAHMGSMSEDCRTRMEIEATEEAVQFLQGRPQRSPVPEDEYQLQSEMK